MLQDVCFIKIASWHEKCYLHMADEMFSKLFMLICIIFLTYCSVHCGFNLYILSCVSINNSVQISGATEMSLWLSRGMSYQMQASYLLWQEQDMYLFHSQILTNRQKAIKLCGTLSNIFLYLYIINFITFSSPAHCNSKVLYLISLGLAEKEGKMSDLFLILNLEKKPWNVKER